MSASGLILETLRRLELAPRLRGFSHLLIELAEQVMSRAVVGVVLNRARQHALGGGRLPLLDIRASEQDVGRAVIRIQPDRFLERGNALVPSRLAHAGVAKL